MPRAPREPASPSAIVPALLRLLGARGRDLASRFGLPDDAAERDELDVVPATVNDLLAAAAVATDDPYLALRLPDELPLRRYDLGELAARSATTLRTSLDQLAAHAALVHPQIACTLVETASEAEWHQATPAHPRGVGRHAHEYALARVLHHIRSVLGQPLPLARAWFAHARPRALAPLERHFGTEDLVFGAEDSGFAFARAALDRPLVTADPRLLATIATLATAEQAERPRTIELAPRVAAHLRARLPDPVSADDVAVALHMSARTLQRRLEAEGTSFTGVVDATREALARELLADPELALGEVAYRVGFADLATFSRAFKRWVGTSPGRFRRGALP